MKNSIVKIVILIFIVFGIIGCVPDNGDNNGDGGNNEKERSPELHLSIDDYVLSVGEESEINYNVIDLDNYQIKFESSNKDIFDIKDNKIVAKSGGSATLRVSVVGYEDLYREALVKVNPKLTLQKDNYDLTVGAEAEIAFLVEDILEYELKFESSNEDIFKVENDKIVTYGAGKAVLKVYIKGFENLSLEAKVNVLPTLTIQQDIYELEVDAQLEVLYEVKGLENYEMKFESSNEQIFKIVDNKIIAYAAGEAKLKISIVGYENIYLEAHVKVTSRPLTPEEEIGLIVESLKETIGIDLYEVKFFPKTNTLFPDARITYRSSDIDVITNDGLIKSIETDQEAIISITVEHKGVTKTIEHSIRVVAKSVRNIVKDFFDQFPYLIVRDLELNFFEAKYPEAELTFRTSDPAIVSSMGTFDKPHDDTELTLYLSVNVPSTGYSNEFSVVKNVPGYTLYEKAEYIQAKILEDLDLTDGWLLTQNFVVPQYDDKFGFAIKWSANYPSLIDSNGVITRALMDVYYQLEGVISLEGDTHTFAVEFRIPRRTKTDDKWTNIEDFLTNYIFIDEIKTMKYFVMGVYPQYAAYNDGYVLFYQNSDVEVIEDYLAVGHSFRPGKVMQAQYVTIHDTANNREGADAEMHSRFIHNESRTASSWHYTIDDSKLYHHVPNNEVAWHAGEAVGNATSIGIETCTNYGVDYDLVIRRTAKLVAKLLDDHGLDVSKVRQHYDWSGKNCPQVIRASNRWNEMLSLTTLELYGRQNLNDVEFEWKSLSPDILDDSGKVFNHPGPETEVSYQVTVTYENVSKTFTHTAIVQAKK